MTDFKWRHYQGAIILGCSWQVDETYVKVKGKWTYLYRAVDKHGNTIDFYLSSTRNKKAAKRFLGKALKSIKPSAHPETINTDKAPTFGPAINELKEEGKCQKDTVHRQIKHLNNIVEADHGKLKRLINPVRGFKSMKTVYATIKGFELMHMLIKGQMDAWKYGQALIEKIRLIERQFDIYST
ncbi:IS6 family transposase [Nitrosomonas mobilis]|uniref:Transposase n=1 Tax=Nitrosomonas mobilis TaxID=51642 RepID=A0A1G5SHT9_9PROT